MESLFCVSSGPRDLAERARCSSWDVQAEWADEATWPREVSTIRPNITLIALYLECVLWSPGMRPYILSQDLQWWFYHDYHGLVKCSYGSLIGDHRREP